MIHLQEHDIISGVNAQIERFEKLSLVSWDKPVDGCSWGYYASYRIGAEWIDENEALVVTTKRGMENIDFLSMFMTCFSSNLEIDSFSEIYSIHAEQPPIEAPALRGVISPLIVLHFIGVVNRIKALKRGYVHRSENLKKVKGKINILKNERTNISLKRYDRIYCNYDEYSVDIPENRLIKKALLFSQRMVQRMGEQHHSYNSVRQMLAKSLSMFENVSNDVDIKSIRQIKGHKLFKEYAEAIRLAKLVLSHFDYSINKVSESDNKIVPFVLDMSLLYEHYVYGLLYEAYQNKITYQYSSLTGKPDFLYHSQGFKAILDTKYIPKYEKQKLDTDVIRQLSGYSRDLKILRYLGYEDVLEEAPLPNVPCVIIYPEEGGEINNPFLNISLKKLCSKSVRGLALFYKIAISVPTLKE